MSPRLILSIIAMYAALYAAVGLWQGYGLWHLGLAVVVFNAGVRTHNRYGDRSLASRVALTAAFGLRSYMRVLNVFFVLLAAYAITHVYPEHVGAYVQPMEAPHPDSAERVALLAGAWALGITITLAVAAVEWARRTWVNYRSDDPLTW